MPINPKTELTQLRRAILTLGAAVEQRVAKVVEALVNHDVEVARFVRTSDTEIDEMEVDIEEECFRALALTQPVAGDLRFILSVLRINNELERIADLAKGIAKRVLHMETEAPVIIPPALTEMAYSALKMLSDALSSLANHDANLCRSVRRSDQRVDDLQKEIFAWVHSEIPRHVEVTQGAIDVLSIARALERIADMSTNIAEDVMFLIEGSVVRHQRV